MAELRSNVEGPNAEIRSLKRRIRILLVIIVILILLSLTLGYCSYSCNQEPKCPVEKPTETARPIITLPPEDSETPPIPPTTTQSPTPDLDATATAACSDFMDEFPGTPCP